MQYNKKNWLYRLLLIPYYLILLFLVIMPLFFLILYSLQETNSNNEIFSTVFTFNPYITFFTNFSLIYVLLRSLAISIVVSIFLFIIVYPLAYIVSKFNFLTQGILVLLIHGTMWINMILKTQALLQILNFCEKFYSIKLLESNIAMFIGLIYLFLPYMFLPIYLSISSIDHHLINVARDLGTNEMQLFKKLVFPLSFKNSFIGCVLVFFQVITNIVVPKYLGPSTIPVISEIIENKTLFYSDIQNSCTVAINLMILMILIFIFCKKIKY